ncbi:hypothetical protein C0991_006363 [Blastosporella zonata]|nr:hypothetical protein C0991_006363 [Blastosporella zonata]
MSFLPPATTIRRYQRNVLATTSAEIGSIYCAIVSFANTRKEDDIEEINRSLGAIRSKLLRTKALRANADYEVTNKPHVLPILTDAFRSHCVGHGRQSDITPYGTSNSMISTALRSGSALPQISPCPLLDRFMSQYHGLDIIHKESEEDYGLPRTLTLETLQNEQYMFFCVGVSTAYGLITRLDRLMVAAKEIVGEQYHIYGIGTGFGRAYPKGSDFGAGSGITTGVHFRPPQEV